MEGGARPKEQRRWRAGRQDQERIGDRTHETNRAAPPGEGALSEAPPDEPEKAGVPSEAHPRQAGARGEGVPALH